MDYLEILIKLRKIIRSINLESKKIQKEFGVSIPQLLIIQFISEQPDNQTTAKDIKNYINLNASTVSGIISRLISKGLVARFESTIDKRISLLSLTMKGLNVLQNTPTTLQEKLSDRLARLSPEQVSQLNQNIDLLITLMDAEDIDASPILTTKEIPPDVSN